VQAVSAAVFFDVHDDLVDPKTLEALAAEIQAVEEELRGQVDSEVELVRRVGTHTLSAGGKRLRPALVAVSASATGLPFDRARVRRLGACMELIHMATLLHDDVIDNAVTRRGLPTAGSVYGGTASILSGDALLAKSMSILAEDGDLEIIRNVSNAVVQLAEGEVAELESRGRFDLTEREHLEILKRKTARFMQSCCQVGGLCARAPLSAVQALGEYGLHLGLAFQIADDLLDYRGDQSRTGKPRATDFREGCPTLPLIRLIPKLSPLEREQAMAMFGNGVADKEIELICAWMETRGAFAEAQKLAQDSVARAVESLACLPDGEGRRLLVAAAEFAVRRSG
jgi:octaprenyl-diphosphate synthase